MAPKYAIPFLDLKPGVDAADVRAAIERVLERGWFVLGPELDAFEQEFAEACHAPHAVGVGTGTDALALALRALGVGPGDEVITSPVSAAYSALAIMMAGARPVFADIDPDRLTLDPRAADAAVTPRTKAIMPVHLYGQPADMDRIQEVAARHSLPLIEDACQSHGARYKGRRTGSMGAFGAFSFYPSKNLGAYGDAGALTTNDSGLADRVRMMRNYGQRAKYDHAYLAWNRRLDTIQAAVLRVKLPHLDEWNESRRNIAELYGELLAGCAVARPHSAPDVEHVYHLYVIEVDDRDRLQSELTGRGIGTGIHYPVPIHLQEAYREAGFQAGWFPVSEAAAKRVLSLPMYPEMREADVRRVAGAVRELVSASARA